MRWSATILAAGLVVVMALALPGPAAASGDPDVERGIKLVSQAYLHLGIAYLGKGHESAAKAQFREALTRIRDLSLSSDRFSPKVIDVFEAAKAEVSRTAGPASSAPAVRSALPRKGVGASGVLEAKLSWENAETLLALDLHLPGSVVATSTRTSRTTANLTLNAGAQHYTLQVLHRGGCADAPPPLSPHCTTPFTLQVVHP